MLKKRNVVRFASVSQCKTIPGFAAHLPVYAPRERALRPVSCLCSAHDCRVSPAIASAGRAPQRHSDEECTASSPSAPSALALTGRNAAAAGRSGALALVLLPAGFPLPLMQCFSLAAIAHLAVLLDLVAPDIARELQSRCSDCLRQLHLAPRRRDRLERVPHRLAWFIARRPFGSSS